MHSAPHAKWLLYLNHCDHCGSGTCTTINWPRIILGLPSLFPSSNKRMPTIVPWYLHLNLSKHIMRNVSRLRLRAHTLKVEAAAWLEGGSRVCDQSPGEDACTVPKRGARSFILSGSPGK